jgi:hypothetical protein
VWVAVSTDDGQTFAAEVPASPAADGACGCCGMRVAAAGKGLWIAYRAAAENVNRDLHIERFDPGKGNFRGIIADPMKSSACMMSTSAMLAEGRELLAAWETDGQVKVQMLDTSLSKPGKKLSLRPGGGRKHPALAVNNQGQVLVAWTEGTGWMRGGSIAWQVFGKDGAPIASARGRAEGLPVWGAPAAWARADGQFVIAY